MASVQNVKGVNQTLIDAGGLSTLAAGLVNGRVKCCVDQYTADGTEAAGSTITMFGDLPKGAKILLMAFSATTAQSSLTVQVGTDYNADEFVLTGATTLQTANAVLMAHGHGYVVGTVDTDEVIQILTEAATLTAGVIYGICFFTTD